MVTMSILITRNLITGKGINAINQIREPTLENPDLIQITHY